MHTPSIRLAAAGAATAAVLAGGLAFAPSAQAVETGGVQHATIAGSSAAADLFGAIAYSQSTGGYAWSYHYPTERSAELSAEGSCGEATGAADCKWVLWIENAWGALATDSNHLYGAGAGTDTGTANYLALQRCIDAGGTGCKVVLTFHS